jgi:polyprenyl-phospho-N-acetylgalactosaminyl synthase
MTNSPYAATADETFRAQALPLPTGTWVVLAAFNEEERIGAVLDELLLVTKNVVVVDDGSSDATGSIVLERTVWLVTHPVNLGQGAAVQTGIAFALAQGASHVVTFDADGQHRTEDIAVLIEALSAANADFALGSRFLGQTEGMPWSRRIVLRLGILFTAVLSGVWLSDAHNGFRAMTRRGAERIAITFNRMEHASEIIDQIVRSHYAFIEVPVCIRYTSDTLSKGQKSTAAIGMALRLLLDKVVK